MQVRVLGATELADGPGDRVAGLSHKQRALLAALTLHRGSGVRAETLIELLWAEQVPRTAAGTLQKRGIHLSPSQVYRLVVDKPGRLNLKALMALMDILGCRMDELVVPVADRRAPGKKAAGQGRAAPGGGVGAFRPKWARIMPDPPS